jgi:hypothetical protein
VTTWIKRADDNNGLLELTPQFLHRQGIKLVRSNATDSPRSEDFRERNLFLVGRVTHDPAADGQRDGDVVVFLVPQANQNADGKITIGLGMR